MRVGFVVGGFPELSETFILDMMTGLIDRGHEIMIFARPPGNAASRGHATVRDYRLTEKVYLWDSARGPRREMLARSVALLRSHPLRTLGDMGRALAAFRQGDNLLRLWSRVTMFRTAPVPDLLFAQFGPNGILAEQARAICGTEVPLATTFLGHDLSRLLQRKSPAYYTRLFAHGEVMLPLSNCFRDRLIAIGCPPDKIQVQRLGVDTTRFAYQARLLAPGSAPRFVSVARLVEKKGLETGLRAFAQLRATLPGASWHIAGDGPLRTHLEQLVPALGLGNSVVLHGAIPREEVHHLLDDSHLFLAPSVTAADGDQEGTPVAIMEAMACGLPVISTHHSGIAELVADGVSGMLVPERDVTALCEAMRQLATTPERWAAMGLEGRAIVEREYDTRILGDRLERILMDLVRRP